MRFEGMLALRYIKVQKRHSVLTVVSIIVALAMMTLIVVCFTTMESCMSARERDLRPYHIQMYDVTKKQTEQLRTYPFIKECNVKSTYTETDESGNEVEYATVNLYLKPGIGNLAEYYDKLCKRIGWTSEATTEFNRKLLNYDMIDDEAKFEKIVSYVGYLIYLIILAMILRLVIDTAFEVSSKERERQFGVLQSIGATPDQVRKILVREGLLLGIIGVPLGIGLGLLLGYGLYHVILYSGIIDAFFESEEKALSVLHYDIQPFTLLICASVGFLWVFLSAYGTGTRAIRLTPIQAISNRSNTVKRVKKHSLFGLLFGWKGKLAARNARRQPKRFVITVLSLTLSLTMFGMFSILIDDFEDIMQDTLVPYDGIGPCRFDFGLLSVGYIGEPFGYQDGYQALENCEHFTDTDLHFDLTSTKLADNSASVSINYLNENCWNRLFSDGDMPMTYSEFAQNGGYFAINSSDVLLPEGAKMLNVITTCLEEIPEEELAKYTEEELEQMLENREIKQTLGTRRTDDVNISDILDDGIMHEDNESPLARIYCNIEYTERTLPIIGSLTSEKSFQLPNEPVTLLAPLSKYESMDYQWYGVTTKVVYLHTALVSDEHYEDALRFFKENGDKFNSVEDMFLSARKVRVAVGAFQIGGTFFIIMFALIALINMINIVSTGILNRRSELASMQCVGMTNGQLYAMTIIECVQFVIIAGIAAIILCALMTKGTQLFLQYLTLEPSGVRGGAVTLFAAVPRILFGTCFAFLAALCASILPLRRMQRDTLVDRIRTVE